MDKSTISIVALTASFLGISAIALIVIYAVDNQTGHTAMDPYLALVVFMPVLATGSTGIAILKKRQLPLWPCTLAIATGCIGIMLLLYLDKTNTLLQYDIWLKRGMP